MSLGIFDPLAVSDRAIELLLPLVEGLCEFLPLAKVGRRHYSVMNVLNVVECLDVERSETRIVGGRINFVDAYAFRFEPSDPVFKVPEWPHETLVNDEFARIVIENELTGATFRDPSKAAISYILKGMPANDVPGSKI